MVWNFKGKLVNDVNHSNSEECSQLNVSIAQKFKSKNLQMVYF